MRGNRNSASRQPGSHGKKSTHKKSAKKPDRSSKPAPKKSPAKKKASQTLPAKKPTNAIPKKKTIAKKKILGRTPSFDTGPLINDFAKMQRVVPKKYLKDIVSKPANIPQKQWELPAGYRQDGSLASLAEVVSIKVPTLSLSSLSTKDKKNLVLERIKLQDDYPTRHMLGVGEVDKTRAIAEIEAGTAAGKSIEESEQILIKMLEAEATKK
jgi:hypothetical protein